MQSTAWDMDALLVRAQKAKEQSQSIIESLRESREVHCAEQSKHRAHRTCMLEHLRQMVATKDAASALVIEDKLRTLVNLADDREAITFISKVVYLLRTKQRGKSLGNQSEEVLATIGLSDIADQYAHRLLDISQTMETLKVLSVTNIVEKADRHDCTIIPFIRKHRRVG